MKLIRHFILAVALMLSSASLPAEEVIQVNAMNYPAWVIRNHQVTALLPGTQILAEDLIRTGERGRVILQLADGSAVKIGPSARFLIEPAGTIAAEGEENLESRFQVLRGAFRFTSSFFNKTSDGHLAKIKIGSIAAEIRGTDIWGRSNPEQDLVVLINGAVMIEDGESRVNLERTRSVYVKPKEAEALPVNRIEADQLRRWADETELAPNQGIAVQDGEWSIVLLSLTSWKNLNRTVKEFHEKGFAVKRKSVIRDGRTLHRLLLTGFVSRQAAINASNQLDEIPGVSDSWVWRYK